MKYEIREIDGQQVKVYLCPAQPNPRKSTIGGAEVRAAVGSYFFRLAQKKTKKRKLNSKMNRRLFKN